MVQFIEFYLRVLNNQPIETCSGQRTSYCQYLTYEEQLVLVGCDYEAPSGSPFVRAVGVILVTYATGELFCYKIRFFYSDQHKIRRGYIEKKKLITKN